VALLVGTSYVGFAMFFFVLRIYFFLDPVETKTGEPGHPHSPVAMCARGQVMLQTAPRPIVMI
jgi:hypothetical protein